jgi:hypothetical protein
MRLGNFGGEGGGGGGGGGGITAITGDVRASGSGSVSSIVATLTGIAGVVSVAIGTALAFGAAPATTGAVRLSDTEAITTRASGTDYTMITASGGAVTAGDTRTATTVHGLTATVTDAYGSSLTLDNTGAGYLTADIASLVSTTGSGISYATDVTGTSVGAFYFTAVGTYSVTGATGGLAIAGTTNLTTSSSQIILYGSNHDLDYVVCDDNDGSIVVQSATGSSLSIAGIGEGTINLDANDADIFLESYDLIVNAGGTLSVNGSSWVLTDASTSFTSVDGSGNYTQVYTSNMSVTAGSVYTLNCGQFSVFGVPGDSQAAAIPDASGGTIVDTQARAAINALLASQRSYGWIAT